MLQSPPPYLDLPPPPVYSLPPSLADTVSQVGEYNYKSDHFHVNLGPRNWGTRFPVYGFQGTVEGTVQFAKKCSRVMSVTATLEGKASISVSRGGSIAAASDKVILSQTTKIFEVSNPNLSGDHSPKPYTSLSQECFRFSLSFQTHITDGGGQLPPSQSLYQQGAHCSIKYTLRVDIVRDGWKRHERITIPIVYLPRSTPPSQVQLDLINDPLLGEDQFVKVDLKNSERARAALDKLQMSAQLTLPTPKIYASGDSIPLILTLSCLTSPPLPQLITKADRLSIRLIKWAKIVASSGNTLQEAVVSEAELKHTDNSTEGVCSSHWVLQLGKTQSHISWEVSESAEVKYLVRVVFEPLPCSVIREFPAFQYDEVVKLTSDPWLDPVIAEELQHVPALGLAPVGLVTNQSAPTSPRSSVASASTRL